MANTIPESPRHPTISDYGLNRSFSGPETVDTKFMEPYIGPTGEASWLSFGVFHNEELLNFYAVSLQLNVYITYCIALTQGEGIGDKRETPMRHRDMMVDNYLAAGGNLKTWRYIVTHAIANAVTRDVIFRCFRAAGADYTQSGSVEVMPGDHEFVDVVFSNPFTRGIQGLLREYEEEMGKAKIKRVIFISEAKGRKDPSSYSYPRFIL
ncbi:hypothetical protein F5X98DRAFT_385868 [Xylaria grammica]|nr:hypothetical protein F5X98DRAFT_385868 [Xylaria grammica]